MSKTLAQIFAANPTATIANTDLFYLVQSPYTPGTDAAITGANLKTALGIGTILPGLAGDLAYYQVGGNTLSPLPTATNGLLVTNALGTPSVLAGPGTSNHLLVSNAAGAPGWSIPTYPNASVLAGKVIISDGTNYIASTPTYPNSSALAGKILISDGTNNIYSTPTYPNASALAGKVIISDGTNFIASTSIFPNTVGALGKFLISDGTSNVYSTSTIPTSAGATANKVLLSDGTNYILSTPTFPNASATLNHFIISDGTNWIASASAINLAGNFTTAGGAFNLTFTLTNNTSLTLPTSGTVATTAQTLNFNNVTSTPIALVDNNGYIVNNGAALVTFTLPATSPIGQRFIIVGHDTGGWKVTQSNVNQHIHLGNKTSTVGLAGFIASTDGNDCVELICTATDNEFTVRNSVGNITVS